jgi:class 3 adenylate cyclase/tetratricopeptide (TPR) repeat protein
MVEMTERSRLLLPYVPRIVVTWLQDEPEARFRELEGSVAFVDISGFTKLSERLGRRGKVGAEVLTEKIGTSFSELLTVAYENGGSLLKFGGDALLLWFSDAGHQARACRAALGMRRILRRIGRLETLAGAVTLRMSVGIHSGRFHFFLAGDSHRELIVTGPAATKTVLMERIATAGEIVISGGTAEALPRRTWGAERGPGRLLVAEPPAQSIDPSELVLEGLVDVSAAVPAAIREHLLAGSAEPEHRQVTVGFVHFGDTDSTIERYGPGKLADALNELVSLIQRAADAHGVAFLGSDIAPGGGKIILTAGTPRATGHHEERMLLALRQIVEGNPPLPVWAGVHRGHVFAGDVGPHYRRTYTVMGDTVNLAARLMAAARHGQVLASEEVAAHTRGHFEMSALEPFLVKGKSRPVKAYSVGTVLAADADRPVADDLPLIGREEELGTLSSALQAARDRSGRAIQLTGPAGVGKTRLVAELRVRANDVTVLSVSCDLYESFTPYFLFRQMLQSVLAIRPGDDPILVEERLRHRVEADAPELVPWLPLLGAPLDLSIEQTEETRVLEDQFRQAKLAELTSRFLALTLPTATLLEVEDAQWMDDASAGLLKILAAEVGERPWLIVITRREFSSGFVLPEGPDSLSMEVRPLARENAFELALAMTEASPLSPHVVAGLAERSGGNPLFLRELLAATRAGGIESLPESVEDLVTARIDLLAPADRRLLRQASVLGLSFSKELFAAVIPGGLPRRKDPIWLRLGDFLERDADGIRFRQTLSRDVAYEGLSYRVRRDLHSRIGDGILKGAQNPEENSALLAMHYFHAARYEEAWRFARIAGDRARTAYANVEAAQLYRQALEAARAASDVPAGQITEVEEALGDVCDRLGEYRGAEMAYRSARRLLADAPVSTARLLLKEAGIPERVGRYSQALRLISRGNKVLEGVEGEDAARERARLSAAYSSIRQAQGRPKDAIRWCRRAITEAEAAGDRDALAHAYAILSWAYASTGDPESGRYSLMALQIYEELGNLGRQALVLNYLGAFAYFDGKWEEARDYYERGRAARERTGDAVGAAYGTINIGEILSDQGHLGEAETLFRAALRVWRAAGYRAGVADALSQMGRAAARSGRFEEALALLSEARSMHEDVGSRAWVLEDDSRIAECHLLNGDFRNALSLAYSALAGASGAEGVGVQIPMLHRIRGLALMGLGEHASARGAFEESLRLGRSRGAEFEVALTLQALADVLRLQGTPEADAGPLEMESRSVLGRLGVVTVPVS